MPIQPSQRFINDIRAYCASIEKPIEEREAREIGQRLLALVELLARPPSTAAAPRFRPIPRAPQVARTREGRTDNTTNEGELAPLEPGDHPRPARPAEEVQSPFPF
ncbi:hypothetical protein HY634_01175 [Candidatus Uhrbacteria bacterium]|nr:hypothetical protein [Candidatus Uhrbacteria bacterium]